MAQEQRCLDNRGSTVHALYCDITYITLWVQEAPPTIGEEIFSVVIYSLHYLSPV